MTTILKNKVRIVLVNTSHPGNIGAAARVMKNMGLSQLYLTQPKLFPHADATSMSAGADDLLNQAIVVETLQEALQGCQLVIGTTARTRKIKHKIIEPKEAASTSYEYASSTDGDIAIVFGRERTGLTNEEVDQCEVLVNIPTEESFSSLNIASAVQVLSYEIYLAFRNNHQHQVSETRQTQLQSLATHDELELFFEHLENTLIDIDFFDPLKSPQIMPKLKHLYHRSDLEKNELNMLRGILTATKKSC